MLIRICYYQYSFPKQLMKFIQQFTETLPEFPHLLKEGQNTEIALYRFNYRNVLFWDYTILHICNMVAEVNN